MDHHQPKVWRAIILGSLLNLTLPTIALTSPSESEILPPNAERIWQEPRFGAGSVNFFSGSTRQVTETHYYASKKGVKQNTQFYEKLWKTKSVEEMGGPLGDRQIIKNPAMPDDQVSIFAKNEFFCIDDAPCEKKMRGAKSIIGVSRTYPESFSDNLKRFNGMDSGDLEKYAAMTWEHIQLTALEGFHSRWPMELLGDCARDAKHQNFIRQNSGLCNYSTWIEINRSNHVERIDSVEKLKSIVLPLKDAKAAASFLNVTNGGVGKTSDPISAYALKVPEGYLLYSRAFGGFGCGNTTHKEAIFLVTPNGETKEIASRIWEGALAFCVD